MPSAVPESRDSSLLPPGDGQWRIELLGGLRASSGNLVVSHFPGRPVAALLARLVLFPRRRHGREELIELLWPGATVDVGRNRLRQVLSTLRGLLEPPGSGATSVIVADRQTLHLNDAAVSCDALEFEQAFRARRNALALALYRGELLPGFQDAWITDERMRLEALHDQLLARDAVSQQSCDETPRDRADGRALLTPAPIASISARLPAYLSSFVGRDADLQRVSVAVQGNRLVTLIGAGGCGKTRLSIEVAKRLAGFDPVVFVGLAECRDGAELADRVRVAARLAGGANAPLVALQTHLANRRTLLVLDNLEQLIDHGGSEALEELLATLPLAHALVTSRRVLRLPGEVECIVAPLSLPEVDADLDDAAGNPAVALFIDRARNVRGDFQLTARNRKDLLAVCRLLEGLPLALEIAASRVRTYPLHEMRTELARRFPLLRRGGSLAARDPRHASLFAAIDWSWQLLAARRQEFLVALTVFRGDCSAADARAVTAADDTHDLLDALVADSLLTVSIDPADEPGGAWRFRMLDSVREFVLEHLDAAEAPTLRQAHRARFLNLASTHAAHNHPIAEAALGNFIEALRSALDDGDPAVALALFLALKLQWESVGTPPEALALMRRAAKEAPVSTERLSPFLSMYARLLLLAGQAEAALACAGRALELAGDDEVARAEAMFAHTRVDWVWKRDGARVIEQAREGLRLARQAGAREIEASALSLVGAITLWGLDEPAQAEPMYKEAEALYLELGNPRGALQAIHGRMGCLYATRQFEQAIRMGLLLERQSEALGNSEAQIVALNLLTASHAKLRHFAEALDSSRREAGLAHRHHKVYNIAHALWSQGRYLAMLHRPEDAAVMMGFSAAYWIEHLGALPAAQAREMAKVRRLVRIQVGAERCAQAWTLGATLPPHDGIRRGSAP